MNILLVYPGYPDTFWSFKHALKFVSKKASFPPLGLLTVASLLPADYNKKLIDMNVTELKDKDILWADYVYISAMSVQSQSADEVIERCKSLNTKMWAGGPHFTSNYEKYDNVDYLVLKEAEITLPQFINDLNDGNAETYLYHRSMVRYYCHSFATLGSYFIEKLFVDEYSIFKRLSI